jgi:hypothetical protein
MFWYGIQAYTGPFRALDSTKMVVIMWLLTKNQEVQQGIIALNLNHYRYCYNVHSNLELHGIKLHSMQEISFLADD